MAEETKVHKAAPYTPFGPEVGQPGFITASTFVKNQRDEALSVPNNWATYSDMANDSCVSEALTATQTLMFLALYKGKWVESEAGTKRSKMLANYLNHNFNSMPQSSWAEACQGFVTHVQDGLSLSEIVARKATSGPYKGNAELVKIAHRLPSSIYAWVWDEKLRNVVQVVQKPLKVSEHIVRKKQTASYLGDITDTTSIITNRSNFREYPIISMDKMVHMRYNPKGSDPQGSSPMNACYSAWQEKQVINQYQIIGVTRDFGGIPVFRAPSELYQSAADPDSPTHAADAKALEGMRHQLANLHAGREAFIMLSSDVIEGGSIPEYDIRFLGVEGNGKQFDISQIIQSKNSEIYSAFSASYLNMGKDGKTGSYNLSTTGFNIHAFILEREIINCVSEIAKLGRLLIEANGLNMSFRDMPRFVPADPDQMTADDFGKLVQRLGSVDKLTPELMTHLTKLFGGPIEGIKKLDFTSKGDTKAGTGMGTSGQGSSSQSNSATNMDNKSFDKEPEMLVRDSYGDGQVALVHKDTGKLHSIIDDKV